MARLHVLTRQAPLPGPSTTVWLDGPEEVRTRWHQLVQDRRTHLTTE
ncbi:hypothetical protein SAMN05446589_9230 [Streptomyces sp. OV198]|nr:hypothetical protein SAMN05446589_9230 [Streptomyces sp. OV198]